VRLKPDGTRWRTGGEVKGKLANGVDSQYSHITSKCGVSCITNADEHTPAASSRLNWRPCRFKWTRPFRRETKSGFCACAITFQTHYTTTGTSHVWFVSVVVTTVLCTPDDGCREYPKHVEWLRSKQRLLKVASCWLFVIKYIINVVALFRIQHTSNIKAVDFPKLPLDRCECMTIPVLCSLRKYASTSRFAF